MSKLSKIQILEYFSFLVFRFRWLSVTTVSSWPPSEYTACCLLDSPVYYQPRMASEVEVPEAQRSKDLVIDHVLCLVWVRVASAYTLCTVSQRTELVEAPPSVLDH